MYLFLESMHLRGIGIYSKSVFTYCLKYYSLYFSPFSLFIGELLTLHNEKNEKGQKWTCSIVILSGYIVQNWGTKSSVSIISKLIYTCRRVFRRVFQSNVARCRTNLCTEYFRFKLMNVLIFYFHSAMRYLVNFNPHNLCY